MGKIFKALEKAQTGDSDTGLKNEDRLNEELSKKNIVPDIKDKTYIPPEKQPPIGAIEPSLISILKPHSRESEQFRSLKNTLLFPEKGVPPRTIMITSPRPDEGKSFVASNLAATIAQSIDEYVLLIDCDLRRPSIHKLFGYGEVDGLSEYFLSSRPLSSVLLKTVVDKLTILPCGGIPENPSELLSSEQMRQLLMEVKLRYMDRYVIIDTPPPIMTSETNAIARQVDGIILVVRHGKTKKKEIEDIIHIYGKEKILGVVYNFVHTRRNDNTAYEKYGYGNY